MRVRNMKCRWATGRWSYDIGRKWRWFDEMAKKEEEGEGFEGDGEMRRLQKWLLW